MTSEQEPSGVAATPPLELEGTHPGQTTAVVQQTEQKNSWFSAARDRDLALGTSLGTLSYLPPEIRLRIYHYVVRHYIGFYSLDCDRTIWLLTGEVKLYKRLPDPDESSVKWGDFEFWGEGLLADFRLTSPTIGEEYDWWFLSTYEFGFVSPLAYHSFMTRLPSRHQSWIKRLRFEIMSREPDTWDSWFSDSDMDEGWMNLCDELPTTLVSVTLDIGRYCRLELPGDCYDIFEIDNQIGNVRRAAEMLSILRKRILRRIPGIQTKVGGQKYDDMGLKDRVTVDQAFEEDVDL